MDYLNIGNYDLGKQERWQAEAAQADLAKQAREANKTESLRYRVGTALIKFGNNLSEKPQINENYSDYRI
jgi:hypothetical protein